MALPYVLIPLWANDYGHDGQSAIFHVLGAWNNGDTPSVREVMRVCGWGWERTAALMLRLWTEAGPAGAPRPPAPYWGRPEKEPHPDVDDPPGHLTHADVVARAVRWLRGYHHCSSAYAEIAIPGEMVFPDAIGFRGSWSILVEAKVSRSDFRADRNKVIHQSPNVCPGQERWYLTPPNLVYPGEIPAGWGLAEVFARTIKIRLPAPIEEADPDRARADMRILAAVARRHEVGAKWDHEAGKFAPCVVRT